MTMKGLSNAIVALVLLIGAVIIAFVVIGVVYGIFGSMSGMPVVDQVGEGIIKYSSSNSGYYVVIVLHSTGFVNVTEAQIVNGPGVPVGGIHTMNIYNSSLSPGYTTVSIFIPQSEFSPQRDAAYTILLILSDGETITASAIYEY